ncbi:hypothetical protein BO71DRAFT_430237 [Aspergillus ellipticus CBS 707.79]|uniref:Uncharacterized protein n=1 Tax=Aspergillus ellipticus CBS 707.79 TaxID=1448320 RepID=A0A319DA28_9EURO|nr:hypothetical protein BO71DRAFT_430237 [Aspergillus ellipticus CBS 707.79]
MLGARYPLRYPPREARNLKSRFREHLDPESLKGLEDPHRALIQGETASKETRNRFGERDTIFEEDPSPRSELVSKPGRFYRTEEAQKNLEVKEDIDSSFSFRISDSISNLSKSPQRNSHRYLGLLGHWNKSDEEQNLPKRKAKKLIKAHQKSTSEGQLPTVRATETRSRRRLFGKRAHSYPLGTDPPSNPHDLGFGSAIRNLLNRRGSKAEQRQKEPVHLADPLQNIPPFGVPSIFTPFPDPQDEASSAEAAAPHSSRCLFSGVPLKVLSNALSANLPSFSRFSFSISIKPATLTVSSFSFSSDLRSDILAIAILASAL